MYISLICTSDTFRTTLCFWNNYETSYLPEEIVEEGKMNHVLWTTDELSFSKVGGCCPRT